MAVFVLAEILYEVCSECCNIYHSVVKHMSLRPTDSLERRVSHSHHLSPNLVRLYTLPHTTDCCGNITDYWILNIQLDGEFMRLRLLNWKGKLLTYPSFLEVRKQVTNASRSEIWNTTAPTFQRKYIIFEIHLLIALHL